MCLTELGFADFNLRINHRQLLRALIQVCEIAPEHEVDAITAIDKLDKVGREGVDKELAARGVSESSRAKLLDVLAHGTSLDQLETKLGDNALGKQALSDLRQVIELCAFNSAADHLKVDPALARGLGYYTGCIFEAQVPDLAGSLGGGGRYDGLIGMFLGKDKQIPACGLSLGLERILVVMEERKMFPAHLSPVDCMLAFVDDKDTALAVQFSHALRQAGFSVDLQARAYKPGKLRQAAETRGVRYVVWIESDGRVEHKVNGDTDERDAAFGNVLTAAGRP
jgi:histidyl-tRNA synthetase